MKRLHLFQPQYVTYLDQVPMVWLPYSTGTIWAYAQSFPSINSSITLEKLHSRRWPIQQVIDSITGDPDICGFSTYMWNEKYNLALAQSIKNKWPNCKIVFGGPQVSVIYSTYEFIDSLVLGEGEEAFTDILSALINDQPIEKIYNKKRLADLDIPSPYVLGIFDDVIQEHPDAVRFNATIETNRGCPYACTYCDWGSLTFSKVKKFPLVKLEQELDWIASRPITSLFITDANFGIFKERDLEIARTIYQKLKDTEVDLINLSYLKNSNSNVFEIAKEFGELTRGVTLSVQTMNPETLRVIKRDNMKVNDLSNMLELAEKYGVPTFTDLILGLPLETLDSWRTGICQLLELGQHSHCDIFICNLLENTELTQVQKKQYQIQSRPARNINAFSIVEESGIDEYGEIVTETSTMTRSDMVNGFLFHWLIQNFHFSGYSQILARYLRDVHNVGYLEFYTNLLNYITSDSDIVGQLYSSQKQGIEDIFEYGYVREPRMELWKFVYRHFYDFYQNIDCVYKTLSKFIEKFQYPINQDVWILQNNFVYRPGQQPFNLSVNYNLYTRTKSKTNYQIDPTLKKQTITKDDFLRLRKKGLLKNRFHVS